MDSLLIIRSISLQQLDRTISQVRAAFPASAIDLLTHEHALEQCRKYAGLRGIIPYGYSKDFSPLRPARNLPEKHYDALVIPFSNLSGAGFLKVMLFALRLQPKNIFSCNLSGAVSPMSKLKIFMRLLTGLLCWPFALALFLLLTLPALPWLAFCALYGSLRRVKKK